MQALEGVCVLGGGGWGVGGLGGVGVKESPLACELPLACYLSVFTLFYFLI